MSIDPYRWLCCPSCRGELERRNGDLHCPVCVFTFPVVEGIPVLFPCDVKEKMPELFGRYWDSKGNAAMYDKLVEGGDSIFETYNHESEVYGLMTLVDPKKVDVVLDAGTGNGRFLEALPEGSFKVGLDASLELLVHTKGRKRGDFLVCAELEHLPFKDGVFSTVISCRVLQHLERQRAAVEELCRVTREEGDVILELYNTWNIKTLWKNIRMSPRLSRIANAPFRTLFRSLSPFSPWGIDYDRYNDWFQVKRWLKGSSMRKISGRGVGFGFHKYLVDTFFINAFLSKRAPAMLRAYYAGILQVERLVGSVRPLTYLMEKFTIKATRTTPRPAHVDR